MLKLVMAFVVWSVLHSVMAATGFKAWVRRRVGERVYEGWYRLVYNGVAAVTLLPVLYLLADLFPNRVLWRIAWPWNLLAIGVQVVGAAGVVVSLAQSDLWQFAGVEQVIRYMRGEGVVERPARLRTDGVYRLVRHPLYFFSLLFLWFVPVMTVGFLLFNGVATAYFAIGSLVEERKLEGVFGEAYRGYRGRVPWLLPLPKGGRRNGNSGEFGGTQRNSRN
jgi:protein-S-isoprenylcysteine O-methyltransferase Ste14